MLWREKWVEDNYTRYLMWYINCKTAPNSLFLPVSILSDIWLCNFSLQEIDSLCLHSLNQGWPCDLLWVTEYRGSKSVPVPKLGLKRPCELLLSQNPARSPGWVVGWRETRRGHGVPPSSSLQRTVSQPPDLGAASPEPCCHVHRDAERFTKELGESKWKPPLRYH